MSHGRQSKCDTKRLKRRMPMTNGSSRNLRRLVALGGAVLLLVAVAPTVAHLSIGATCVVMLLGMPARARAPCNGVVRKVHQSENPALSFWPPGRSMSESSFSINGGPSGGWTRKNHFVMSKRFCGARSSMGSSRSGGRDFGLMHYRARDQNDNLGASSVMWLRNVRMSMSQLAMA